jgi:hypothetical protein
MVGFRFLGASLIHRHYVFSVPPKPDEPHPSLSVAGRSLHPHDYQLA